MGRDPRSGRVIEAGTFLPAPELDDRVQVECWCTARIVWVTVSDVRKGLTGSCGDTDCRK